MFLKAIKPFLLLYFIVNGLIAIAQTDSLLQAQMKFDFGLVRDKNRHIWPLVYKHKTQDYKDLQLLFTIYRNYQSYSNPSRHNHILPFYWYDSNATIKDVRIGTLFYPNLFRIISDTSNQSKSFRFLELAPEISLLNVTKSKTGLLTQNNFFFFIWGKNDVLNQKSNFVVFPFYWYYNNRYRTSNTLFPIYKYVKIKDVKEQKFTFYPALYFYKKDNQVIRHSAGLLFYTKKYDKGMARKTVLFPIMFSNFNNEFKKFTLIPLVHYDKVKSNNKLNLGITPLFWHKSTNYSNRNVLFPIYWQKSETYSNDSSRRTFLAPVYYSKVTSIGKKKYYIPMVWFDRTLNDTSLTVIPLFYSYKNYANKYHTLLPFYFYKNNYFTQTKTIAITPFYWQNKAENYNNYWLIPFWNSVSFINKTDTFFKQNFYPLVYYKTNKNTNRLTVFPLFYQSRDKQNLSNNTYIFPNYLSVTDTLSKFKTILPIYYYNKNKTATNHVLLPIWFYKKTFETKDTSKSNLILPIYYGYKSKKESTTLLLPIYYKNKYHYQIWNEKTIALFPIYFRNKVEGRSSTLGITPLYWSYYKSDSTLKIFENYHTLFPIWWQKSVTKNNFTTKSNTILPVYFSKTEGRYKHQVLFPIIWKYQDTTYLNSYKSLTVFPFYQSYTLTKLNYQLSAYSPFVWRVKSDNKSKYIVFPFVWSHKRVLKNDTINNTIIFPIYWNYKSNYYHNSILFPIVWSYKNNERKSLTVFPFFHFDKSGNDSNTVTHTYVFPLFYKTKSLFNNSTNLFPFYFSKKTTEENNNVLFPIWYSHKNKVDTSKVLFPFYLQYKTNDYKTIGLTPIFWSKTGPGFNKIVLFPIWWCKTDLKEKTRTLFPLYHYQAANNGLTKTIGIFPLFWYFKDGTYSSKLLFPLWFNSVNTGNDAYQSNYIFPNLYSYKSNTIKKFNIYPFVFSFKSASLKSFVFAPCYFTEEKFELNITKRRTMITPLVWINNDSSNIQLNRFRILPIYWHKKTIRLESTKTSNTFFPIYFDVIKRKNNSVTERKHVIFPIVWSFTSTNSKWFSFVPLMHYNKNQTSRNLAITPLFWSINNTKKQQNLLWPLYNYNRFKDSRNTRFNIAYLLYRYQKTDKVKAWNIAWPLVQRIKGDNYSYFHAAPIVWYKKSDSMNYLSIQPLFFSQKTNEYKRFQLLWQLYSYRKTFNIKTTNNFLWRTFYNTKYTNGDYENRLLYKLYVNNKKDSSTEKTLLPLYSIEKQKNGDYYKGYFLSIYQKTKTQIPNTNHYYLEEKIFWYIRLRSNFNYLKQKSIVTDRKSLVR